MGVEKRLFLKKQPRQGRSKATVEAILEASTHILTREGYACFNTNRVAEKAGVSIASLYQYFVDKDAILAELQRRHVERTRDSAASVVERYKAGDLKVLVAQLIESGIAAHKADPELHRIFGRLASGEETSDGDPINDIHYLHDLQMALESRHIESDDAEFLVWMLRTVVHAAIHEGVFHRYRDVVSGRLADMLNPMVMGWLEGQVETGSSTDRMT